MHVCISFHVMILSPQKTQVEVQRAAARALRSVPCGPSWIPVTKVPGETLRSSVANRDVTAAVQTMGISPGFIGPNL